MNLWLGLAIAAGLCPVGAAGAAEAPVVEGGGLRFRTDEAGVTILHGAKLQPVAVAVTAVSPETAGCVVTGRLPDLDVDVTLRYRDQGGALRVAVEFANAGAVQRLFEVRLAVPLDVAAGTAAEVFDGFDRKTLESRDLISEGLGRRLPLVAASTSAGGVAIGIEAADMHSWLAGGVRYRQGRPHVELALRRVLDPKGREAARFVAYAFAGRWGTDTAIDRYYDLFPEAFRVPEGVDPRVSGIAGYTHGTEPKELIWEECRRLRQSWQPSWSFRRTGDWMPSRELWPAQAGDYDAFIATTRQFYASRAPGNIICHYLEVCQCEKELAEQHYPDSIQMSKTGRTTPFLSAVPVLLGEATYSMFPGGRFYQDTLADVPRILGELKAGGIYIDNASGGRVHYGRDLTGYPGRAFDHDGAVFAVSGVGTAGVMDLAHRTRTSRGPLAPATCNGVGTYLVAFHTDATIQEGIPWEHAEGVAAMRRLMGGKSVCWWEDHLEMALRWRALTPAQIIEAMQANVQYCLLYGLRWGVPPAVHVARGRAAFVRYLPLFVELVHAGWRPLVPVKADPRLWLGRFGQGLGCLLTVSNPTREPIVASLEIDNRFLDLAAGPAVYVFAFHEKTDEGGQPLTNELQADGITRLRLDLAPKAFRVLRAVARASNPQAGRSVQAAERRDAYDRLAVSVTPSAGMELLNVPEAVERRSTAQELRDLPWLRDDRPNATIVLSEGATEREKEAASRLAVYFEYWHGRRAHLTGKSAILVDPGRRLPIVGSAAAASGGSSGRVTVVIRTADRPASIGCRPDKGAPTVEIVGRRPEEVEAAVLKLLELLDSRFPVRWGLSGSPMWNKAGLDGREFTGRESPPAEAAPAPATSPAEVPADNLLVNGGFEQGESSPTGWAYSSPDVSTHRCRFTPDAPEGRRAVNVPAGNYWSQPVALQPKARYRLTVWYKFGPGATLFLWPCGVKADGSELSAGRTYVQCPRRNDLVPLFLPAEWFNRPGVWQQEEMVFTAPEAPQTAIRLGGWGEVWLDAAVLRPVR